MFQKIEIYQVKEWEEEDEKKNKNDLKYETKIYQYIFQQYETLRSFGESTYTRKSNIVEAEEDQRNLLKDIVEFNDKSRTRSKERKDKKYILMKAYMPFMKVEN